MRTLFMHHAMNRSHRFFKLFFVLKVAQITREHQPNDRRVTGHHRQRVFFCVAPESFGDGIVQPIAKQLPVFGMLDGGLDLAATMQQ